MRTITSLLVVLATLATSRAQANEVDFAKQVQPIFRQHCAGCHGEEKGLGKLRLHSVEAIQTKWNDDDHLIVKGKPDESELYERLVLPADHKKFMPKKGKPLPKEQLSLIRQWIEQGAAFTVATDAKPNASPKQDHSNAPPKTESKKVPLPEVEPADPAAIGKLTEAGAQVSALFAGSPLLQVSFALRGEPATEADLQLLGPVSNQVYSLNLAKAQISNKGLAPLSQLTNLSKLHLENSSVTDGGLAPLASLKRLQYLNLYGTQITDAGLEPLKGLESLQKLYVWQTKVTYDMAQQMQKDSAGLTVDLGFDHPVVMRKRLSKLLAHAKKTSEEADANFKRAKSAFDLAKQDQEVWKKRLDDLQKQLDELNGK